ncbi:stage II sporulation protein M [Nocardioides marmoribigeumensis]|uniref:Membrane protein SpoIIM required for sporulation n=1 Tax=Nocardioides marmoribigeumensis TaxID=433649 RepID=A0ABU2BWC9_9ACTN|nr:stage II sporulation protein M [Nocardioides marmoribigeumensis]MDR7362943.1 putative membrane protein SpoIIM required for sporulation [Nocardioides marmoribigeumensis]
MDLDALAAVHREEWVRLDRLSRRRRLSGEEADELVDLYTEVATHLSLVRSQAPDAEVIAYLSSVLARARSRQTGTRSASWRAAGDFFLRRFPAALYRTRWWWATTALANLAVAFLMGWWLLRHPEVETGLVGADRARQIASQDFEGYYSTYAASHFAAQVWTNNAWVAALCIGLGVFGVPVLWVLFQNVANLALMGSVMVRHDRGELFFGLILPHGLLELTAVFVAAGVGLRIFWSWVRPGHLTRGQSLAREGRSAAGVAMGLVVVLLVSGVIEAFVTPSPLPTWARIGIGVVAEVSFLAYVLVVGRAAVRAGETGDVDADLLEASVATAG